MKQKEALISLHNTEEQLFVQIKQMLDNARRHIARTVNSTTVEAYWQVGKYIVEYEQQGNVRAEYGKGVLYHEIENLYSLRLFFLLVIIVFRNSRISIAMFMRTTATMPRSWWSWKASTWCSLTRNPWLCQSKSIESTWRSVREGLKVASRSNLCFPFYPPVYAAAIVRQMQEKHSII